MKAFLSILVVIIVLGIFAGAVRGVKTSPTSDASARLRYCPDEKIVNRMPGTEPQSSYYIVNGERKEISEFDAQWVAANCNIPEQVVY